MELLCIAGGNVNWYSYIENCRKVCILVFIKEGHSAIWTIGNMLNKIGEKMKTDLYVAPEIVKHIATENI